MRRALAGTTRAVTKMKSPKTRRPMPLFEIVATNNAQNRTIRNVKTIAACRRNVSDVQETTAATSAPYPEKNRLNATTVGKRTQPVTAAAGPYYRPRSDRRQRTGNQERPTPVHLAPPPAEEHPQREHSGPPAQQKPRSGAKKPSGNTENHTSTTTAAPPPPAEEAENGINARGPTNTRESHSRSTTPRPPPAAGSHSRQLLQHRSTAKRQHDNHKRRSRPTSTGNCRHRTPHGSHDGSHRHAQERDREASHLHGQHENRPKKPRWQIDPYKG
ncbi:serine/arginine repetitive matrix protein 2-like [Schistocerca piceifrons]|uniref:serine/arginine repetitive matrix protein 2-like n=1 Tax=Schistocerca piceifrons TaxID=274613 RepID=UPI001F5EC1E5|nr:serine/arginine repetitive matrix protein 2-like [Schistocerca piceifrons]